MKEKTVISGPHAAERILETVDYPVLMIDHESRIAYVNSSMERMLGVSRKYLLGGLMVDVLCGGEKFDRFGRYCSPVLETLETGKEFTLQPFRLKTIYNEMPGSYLVTTKIIKNNRDIIAGACGFFYDAAAHWHLSKKASPKKMSVSSEHLETIYAFAEAIGARDYYTMGHSEKVAEYSRMIAERMGLDEKTADLVYLCGIVHDVGKIGVPENILNKPGQLSEEEFKYITRHPEMGASILFHISWLEEVVPVILSHHEKFNGTGYPKGIKGEEIPLLSRILAVADAFDAMTSDRSYRKALPLDMALQELRKNAGKQFDPQIVELFIELISEYF